MMNCCAVRTNDDDDFFPRLSLFLLCADLASLNVNDETMKKTMKSIDDDDGHDFDGDDDLMMMMMTMIVLFSFRPPIPIPFLIDDDGDHDDDDDRHFRCLTTFLFVHSMLYHFLIRVFRFLIQLSSLSLIQEIGPWAAAAAAAEVAEEVAEEAEAEVAAVASPPAVKAEVPAALAPLVKAVKEAVF